MRTTIYRSAVAAAFAVVLSLVAADALLAARAWPARIRFLPSEEPAVYLEIQSAQLSIADSAEGLQHAAPVKASDKHIEYMGRDEVYQSYTFAETTLPVTIEGVTKVAASFNFSRVYRLGESHSVPREEAWIYGTFRIFRPDAAGVTWTYVLGSGQAMSASRDSLQARTVEPPTLEIPNIEDLKLTVETKVEGKKARIGLRLKAGKATIQEALKQGKGSRATIEVTNKKGEVVHKQRGDLKKFGFT